MPDSSSKEMEGIMGGSRIRVPNVDKKWEKKKKKTLAYQKIRNKNFISDIKSSRNFPIMHIQVLTTLLLIITVKDQKNE